jgi:hypothetical protein
VRGCNNAILVVGGLCRSACTYTRGGASWAVALGAHFAWGLVSEPLDFREHVGVPTTSSVGRRAHTPRGRRRRARAWYSPRPGSRSAGSPWQKRVAAMKEASAVASVRITKRIVEGERRGSARIAKRAVASTRRGARASAGPRR